MRIFDLFPFFNEAALLHLRVAELDHVVTDYGFSELPRTFTDKPKGIWLHHNWPVYLHGDHRFHAYQYKDADIPSGPHPAVDWFQRRSLGALLQFAEADDVVILSDVDEIPNRDIVRAVINANYDHPVTLNMHLYYHRVDLKDPGRWPGTVVCRRRHLGAEPDMQELRDNRHHFPKIEDGGWHFSWLGDAAAIANKLEAVDIERESAIYGSGGIQAPPKDREFLQACYERGDDLFRRGRQKQRVPIIPGVNQPHEIVSWLEKYPQYAAMDTVPY